MKNQVPNLTCQITKNGEICDNELTLVGPGEGLGVHRGDEGKPPLAFRTMKKVRVFAS